MPILTSIEFSNLRPGDKIMVDYDYSDFSTVYKVIRFIPETNSLLCYNIETHKKKLIHFHTFQKSGYHIYRVI